MADHEMKTGDTLPELRTTLKDGDKQPVNIFMADVRFVMESYDGTVLLDAEAINLDDNAEENTGKVVYFWQVGDTDVEGPYRAEFQVTFNGQSGDEYETFPNGGYKTVAIFPRLGSGS